MESMAPREVPREPDEHLWGTWGIIRYLHRFTSKMTLYRPWNTPPSHRCSHSSSASIALPFPAGRGNIAIVHAGLSNESLSTLPPNPSFSSSPSRFASRQGTELFDKVQKAKLLVVGAGGIGKRHSIRYRWVLVVACSTVVLPFTAVVEVHHTAGYWFKSLSTSVVTLLLHSYSRCFWCC